MAILNLKEIRNIIFDLGIVLLDLDFEKASQEFEKIGFENFSSYYSKVHALKFFHDFETGKVSSEEFIEILHEQIKDNVNDNEIIEAWNSIIVGFPEEKILFIKEISKHYKIFMLSNTNALHAIKYEKQFSDVAGGKLKDFFSRIYYSHTIGFRKPDIRSFQIILNENNLNPQNTLFVDDIEENLEPAKKLGMQIFHYTKGMDLFSIFNGTDNN